MRLLDRYLFRELLLPLAYCVLGFVMGFLVFDVFSMIDDFQRNRLTSIEILRYYANKIPELIMMSYVLPMGLLLALLYALTNHSRHNELTAMRAAGISLARITLPYFVVGTLFSVGMFLLNEQVVPDATERAEQILYRRAGGKDVKRVVRTRVAFANAVDRRMWQIIEYNLQTRAMTKVHIDWTKPGGVHETIIADRGTWAKRHWTLTNVQVFVYSNALDVPIESRTMPVLELPRDWMETPRLIQSEIKISSIDDLRSLRKTQLSSGAILDYLALHPQLEGRKRDELATMLHNRIASPLTCFVVVLIAIPFGALTGRRNVFVGVASSIAICFLFFVGQQFALALGSGGRIEPWIAAWLPNIAFALTGCLLMWRVR